MVNALEGICTVDLFGSTARCTLIAHIETGKDECYIECMQGGWREQRNTSEVDIEYSLATLAVINTTLPSKGSGSAAYNHIKAYCQSY